MRSDGAGTGPGGAADRGVPWIVAGFLVAVSALRLLYLASGALDLSPDEAHYWEWSRRLDLSYYSKGPLVAYLIAALTSALGTSAFAIRTGAVALSALGACAMYRLARTAFGDARPGMLAVLGLQVTPLFWAGSLLMTIDPPFLVLWVLALLLLQRAMVGGSVRAWLWAGVAVGLGLLAKYTMLFVLPGVILYLWRAPEARRWLRRPAPYLAAAVALLALTPVIVWNVRRGWVSAQHVASQGRGSGVTWIHLAEFLGSQIGVLTPIVAGLLAWGAWHGLREGLWRRREPYRFLMAFATPILAFYLALAVQGKVQANWAAAAYPPLALVTAGVLLEGSTRGARGRRAPRRVLLATAWSLALAVSLLGHATDLLGLPPGLDPTTRLKGWRELGEAVAGVRAGMPAPDRTFLVSDRYQITSELAFYVPGHPTAYNLNLGRRLNQYDFWEGPGSRIGWDAVYVREGRGPLDERVADAFERTDDPVVVEVRRADRVVRTFTLYRGYGFRGLPQSVDPPKY